MLYEGRSGRAEACFLVDDLFASRPNIVRDIRGRQVARPCWNRGGLRLVKLLAKPDMDCSSQDGGDSLVGMGVRLNSPCASSLTRRR